LERSADASVRCMDFQRLPQTPEHIGPGKYLGHEDYAWEPSLAPFGSRRPRFSWGREPPAALGKEHRDRAHRALEQEKQAQFEEGTLRALESWLDKHRLNLADVVVFSLKVQNLDVTRLCENGALALAFEEKVTDSVASLAADGIDSKDVAVTLSPGSTIGWTAIVRCRVKPPKGVRADAIAEHVMSEAFTEAVSFDLARVEGIAEVYTGSWPIRVGIFGCPKLEPEKFGCHTLMPGPDAPEKCKECSSYHFWLCCFCGVAQYEKPCASGCDSGKFGWICISSKCKDLTTVDNALVTCGCWRRAQYHISNLAK